MTAGTFLTDNNWEDFSHGGHQNEDEGHPEDPPQLPPPGPQPAGPGRQLPPDEGCQGGHYHGQAVDKVSRGGSDDLKDLKLIILLNFIP